MGNIKLPLEKWSNNPAIQESALEKAFKSPKIRFTYGTDQPSTPTGYGPCLPEDSIISTSEGLVPIKNLKVGDFVWTVDRFGRRVQTVIAKKAKRIVSKNHKVVHIVLEDGIELVVSLGHLTIDYREIGSLVKGDNLDISFVSSIKVMPYKGNIHTIFCLMEKQEVTGRITYLLGVHYPVNFRKQLVMVYINLRISRSKACLKSRIIGQWVLGKTVSIKHALEYFSKIVSHTSLITSKPLKLPTIAKAMILFLSAIAPLSFFAVSLKVEPEPAASSIRSTLE